VKTTASLYGQIATAAVASRRSVIVPRDRTAYEQVRPDPVASEMPARTDTEEQTTVRSVLGFNVCWNPGFELDGPGLREKETE
jgi:hypothetical protein